LPTFRHNKELDFFINGLPFDQKTAKSPTQEFINDHEDYRQVAKSNLSRVHNSCLKTCGNLGEPKQKLSLI